MRKIHWLVAALVIALAAGCGGDDKDDKKKETTDSGSTATDAGKTTGDATTATDSGAAKTDGGTAGLGFIRGGIDVDPDAWFFKAHFHQDPVWPGSLGLEAFLQLLKYVAWRRFDLSPDAAFSTMPLGHQHEWTYRGQIIPNCRRVQVEASITSIDPVRRMLVADGFLIVDGRTVYELKDFALECPLIS